MFVQQFKSYDETKKLIKIKAMMRLFVLFLNYGTVNSLVIFFNFCISAYEFLVSL